MIEEAKKKLIDEMAKSKDSYVQAIGNYVLKQIEINTDAKRYAEGNTTILFIRKKEEEDKPFYTVEIKEDKVMQIHGKGNINPDEEVKEFMEAFKESILNKTKKNKKVA